MKLVIEISLDGNDLEDSDLDRFVKEAKLAMGINIQVGRSISERTPDVIRHFAIHAEYFKAELFATYVSELDCTSNCATKEGNPCDCQPRG